MDLSASIDYDSFSVNTLTLVPGGRPSSGYTVDQVEMSDIEVAAFAEKRALTDGIDASDVYLGRRRIGMIVTPYGTSRGDFWDKLQDLLAAFSPTLAYGSDTSSLGFLPLNFTQPTEAGAYPNGIPMRMYVRPATPPAYTIRRDELGGDDARGLSLPVRLSLVARDPRKYLQSTTTISISSGTTSVSTQTTYEGDYPTGEATVTIISGATTGTATLRIEGSDFEITIDAASTTYELDLVRRTYEKAGSINMGLLIDVESWPPIGAENQVNLVREGSTCPISVSLTYRPAFA